MTRIMLVGDIHAGLLALEADVCAAKDAECSRVFFLGDFGYRFSDNFIELGRELWLDTGLTIDWIDGNHEDFDYLESINFDLGPGFTYHPRGSVEVIDGKRILFLGGATSVDAQWRTPGASWWPQEELTEAQVASACSQGRVDIVLAHDAPYLPLLSNKDLDSPSFPESELLRSAQHRDKVQAVYQTAQPLAWCHGHYHTHYETSKLEPWGPTTLVGLNMEFEPGHRTVISL